MLNPAQRAAVERWEQDVCVVAGPGSGKTRVLIERFRWLVEHKGIPPHRILAVTFTEKAATEIKQRLIDAFPDSSGVREDIERAWVSTIHGFCTRLLKENAVAAGIDPEFRLIDETEARIAMRRCAEAALDQILEEHAATMRVLIFELAAGASDIAACVVDLYEEARSAGVGIESIRGPETGPPNPWRAIESAARVILTDPPNGTFKQRDAHIKLHHWARETLRVRSIELLDAMPKASGLKIGTRARAVAQELRETVAPAVKAEMILSERRVVYPHIVDALRRTHTAYTAWKRAGSCLDFEDLQEFAIRLLEQNPDLRHRVSSRFDQILMDELQDTNRLQWRLIDLLRRPDSLFAVGDVNQSIYFFRHADPGVFREYRDRVAAAGHTIDELRENYRTRPPVLEAINAIVPYLIGGVEPHRLEARREDSPVEGSRVEFLHTFAAKPTDDPVQTEARWIANRIAELNAPYSSVAVLARTIGALAPVQEALDEFGIPAIVSGGRSFHEAREIRDLTGWLAVLANPRDELSLALVLRSPLVGIPPHVLMSMRPSESLCESLDAAALSDERLHWFWNLIQQQRRRMDAAAPDLLLAEAMDQSGYETQLSPRARANAGKFLAMLRDWHARAPRTMNELVEELRDRRDIGSEAEAAAEATDCVRLMSVHAAKGLEFPVVFVAALRSAGQLREPTLCFDPEFTLGARWRHPGGGRAISDPVHLNVAAAKARQERAEEDRLLYVAMTRAGERLIFTASPHGQGDWARRVCEGLLLPAGTPKEERSESGRVRLIHTSEEVTPGVPRRTVATAPPQVYADRIEPGGQHESSFPVTSLAQYAFCPRQYYLARYLEWPPHPAVPENPQPRETSAAELGIAIHEILAGNAPPEPGGETERMVRGFERSFLGEALRGASSIEREFDFLVEIEGLILSGQIDLWFERDGEAVVVDYKSDLVERGRERWHAVRYGPQVRLYALALARTLGRVPERAYLWYLRTEQAVEVRLDEAGLTAARNLAGQLREAQSRVEFPLREGEHCRRCGYYRGACPSRFGLKAEEEAPKSEV